MLFPFRSTQITSTDSKIDRPDQLGSTISFKCRTPIAAAEPHKVLIRGRSTRARGPRRLLRRIYSRSRWIASVRLCINTTVSTHTSLLSSRDLIIIQSVSDALACRWIFVDPFPQHLFLRFSDISPEIKAKRRIFEIINTVQTQNPEIFSPRPAFDGKKNIFSFRPILPSDGKVFPCKPEGAINEYTVTIRLVAQVESE